METVRENIAKTTRQLGRQAQQKMQKETLRFARKLKLEITDEDLTATAGIGPLLEQFQKSPLSPPLTESLPLRTGPRSLGSFRIALVLLAGFLRGFDSISDWEEFRKDPHFKALFNDQVPASRTLEDFFNDFNQNNTKLLNQYLHSMAMSLRGHLKESLDDEHKPGPIIWDIDATPHVQYGKKMEGVEKNYKGDMSLNSQSVFDELGFCHGVQLRPRNAEKDSEQAVELLEQVFAGFKFQNGAGCSQLDALVVSDHEPIEARIFKKTSSNLFKCSREADLSFQTVDIENTQTYSPGGDAYDTGVAGNAHTCPRIHLS